MHHPELALLTVIRRSIVHIDDASDRDATWSENSTTWMIHRAYLRWMREPTYRLRSIAGRPKVVDSSPVNTVWVEHPEEFSDWVTKYSNRSSARPNGWTEASSIAWRMRQ